ncbi:MAG: electron transfer flavoprotein subunit alpha/FixB family protein [Clostridia bacterium]|nr:electron transfer flavoprotein subunit alpha/FixB family protein [Clostridia bacterium]
MGKGIFIYAEQFDQCAEPFTAELVTAVKQLKANEPVTVFAVGDETLLPQLQWDDVAVKVISCSNLSAFQEDAAAVVVADFLKQEDPAYVIVPATGTAKSLFSRVAVLLDVGLTADCTELSMEDGNFIQKKPAFGSEAMVITEETDSPAMVTVITGIYPPCETGKASSEAVISAEAPASGVEFISVEEQEVDSIVDAEYLLSLGRGALQGDSIDTAKALADAMGAAIGGTRPLVDNGTIPFEQQIGQTGCTVHPKVCLFFGVSGAIQHTEGVRDAKLTVAVNTDENAGIFSFADYGAKADSNEVMAALTAKLNQMKG